MPLTGGRIVHSLNQAQGVILETLKEREKDRAEERKEELSAGGLALPSSRSAWPHCLLTAWVGGEPSLSGGLQAGQGSTPHLPSPAFKMQEKSRSYLNRLHPQGPQVLPRPGWDLYNDIDLSQPPCNPLLPADQAFVSVVSQHVPP